MFSTKTESFTSDSIIGNEEDSTSIHMSEVSLPHIKPTSAKVSEEKLDKAILTKAHRTQLLEQAKAIRHQKKRATTKSLELNKILFDYLKSKGISSHDEGKFSSQSLAKYHEVLERFYKIYMQNESMNRKISGRIKKATQEKEQAVDEMDRLRNGEPKNYRK